MKKYLKQNSPNISILLYIFIGLFVSSKTSKEENNNE